MGAAMGKLAGLVTDHACDKPRKFTTQYFIPSEFREKLLRLQGCLGKVVYKMTPAWTVRVIKSLQGQLQL